MNQSSSPQPVDLTTNTEGQLGSHFALKNDAVMVSETSPIQPTAASPRKRIHINNIPVILQ
jgi:hypothetical protein